MKRWRQRAGRIVDATLLMLLMVKRVGPDTTGVSIDLGLPGRRQRVEGHEACSLDPPHVSSYDLQVEEGTAAGVVRWMIVGPGATRRGESDAYRAASSFWRSGVSPLRGSSYAAVR